MYNNVFSQCQQSLYSVTVDFDATAAIVTTNAIDVSIDTENVLLS